MRKIRSFWTRLCAYALGLLGLGSAIGCEEIEDIFGGGGGNLCMYGTPTMSYEIKGKVVDSDSGKAIEGIKVGRYDFNGAAEVFSDGSGKFDLSGSDFPSDTLHLKVTDVDGETGGLYSGDEVTVNLKQTEKSTDEWYAGKYEADDGVIKMKKASSAK